MQTLAVLQARMTSSRLPGKVMEPILGVPMIGRQIERLTRASHFDGLVVATSTDESDQVLVDFVRELGVEVVRGSLDDVLDRYVQAVVKFRPDAVVRLTGDCPLASPAVIDRVVEQFMSTECDYTSNTLKPTFPDGLDVEVVRAEALLWLAENSTDPHEREHVTLGIYRRPGRFKVENFAGSQDLSHLRWTVDNAGDLAFVRAVYDHLYPTNPAFELEDVLELVESDVGISRTTMDAERNAALKGLDTGAMNA